MTRNSTTPFLTLAILFLFSLNGFAASPKEENKHGWPYGGLKTHIVEKVEACAPQPARKITFNPKIGKLINKQAKSDAPWPITRVIQTKIAQNEKDIYFIDFDPGPSCDPGFSIILSDKEDPVGTIGADHIIIPGNGFIYSVARSNEHFTVRRKFALNKGKIIEVPQPFLFVGLQTMAKRKLELRSAKEGGMVVASVPKGGGLTVVLNEGDHYLIKTEFGLVGWIRLEPGFQVAEDIEGISYLGD